jgi:hypothetical protein
MNFDPDLILRTLDAHGVDFLIIGGLAGNIRGTADVTNDLDVCYAREGANLGKLASALQELGATLRVAGPVDGPLPFQLDAATLRLGDSFTFSTEAGDLDILGSPSGTAGYEDLIQGASRFDLGDGLQVDVAGLDDLIRMKRAAQRPKDLLHVEHLEALARVIDRAREAGLDPGQGK